MPISMSQLQGKNSFYNDNDKQNYLIFKFIILILILKKMNKTKKFKLPRY